MMNSLHFSRLLALGGLCLASLCHAQSSTPAVPPNSTVVLRAGSATLTKADYERLVLGFDRNSGAPLSNSNVQSQQAGREVARLLALVDEATKRGIDQDPEIASLIRVRGYVLMANALFARLVADMKKDEAGTRAYWESHKTEYVALATRQILIRHKGAASEDPKAKGLTRSEPQAKAALERIQDEIKRGLDFADAAKRYSDDSSTSAAGGTLPDFTRGAMVSEFEAAAFALRAGEISKPVKTKYGYHLIQLVEQRPFAFDKVRATLEYSRAKEAFDKIGTVGIELNPDYFKP